MRTLRLTPRDTARARTLFTLMAEVFSEPHEPLSDAYLARLLGREDVWAFAALVGDEIVGGATGYVLPLTRREASELFLYDIAIRPDHQRKGIGRRLLAALREEASAAGIHEVFVPADDEDLHALDFYRALGGVPSPVTFFTFPAGG